MTHKHLIPISFSLFYLVSTLSLCGQSLENVVAKFPLNNATGVNPDTHLILVFPSKPILGWIPAMAPLIISNPETVKATTGGTVNLQVNVASIPEASYQWLKGGKPISGATNANLKIDNVTSKDVGTYYVNIRNDSGSINSSKTELSLKTDQNNKT